MVRIDKMIYLWKIPDDYPEKLIGKYDRENSPDRFLYKKGESLSDDLKQPIFNFDVTCEELYQIDDLANNALVPLVSERLADVLQKAVPDDIQLIKAKVKTKDGELSGYSVLNVLNKVVGIDKKSSKYTLIPGTDKIMGFKYLKYNDDCLDVYNVARDEEYSSNLLISEALSNKLIAMKLNQVGLYKPEDICW